jgi:virulence-associated protein VapD
MKTAGSQECGKRVKKGADGLLGKDLSTLKKEVKRLNPDVQYVDRMTRQELSVMLRNCEDLGGLAWKDNSCYMDSILVALFHLPDSYFINTFIQKAPKHKNKELNAIALEIKRVLRGAVYVIQKKHIAYCMSLRTLMKQFDAMYQRVYDVRIEEVEWMHTQLEPSDVIRAFLRIFDVPNDCEYKFSYFGIKRGGTNKRHVSDGTRQTNFADVQIEADELLKQANNVLDISDYLPIMETRDIFEDDELWKPEPNKEYGTRVVRKTYTKAPALYVHIGRNFGGEKLKTLIHPVKKLKLRGNDRPLYLRSILIHHGDDADHGHYTCYLHCKDDWYHYNDMGFKQHKLTGKLETVLKENDKYVMRNLVGLVYV